MDYLKIPRLLIYKDRNDLKDFGVQTPDTMNYLLFMYLKQQALMGVPGAREVALRCFNNAYYICTLILLEADDFPELRISDYVDKILEKEKGKGYVDEVCLASMAMACLLLAKYDEKRYGTDSEIWKKIYYRCTHYQWYHSSATEIFLNMMSWDYNITSSLSHIEFAPRDIIEAIEEASPLNLAIGHKYICNSLSNVTDRRKAIYGADLAISRLNDDLREIYEDWEYNPDTDSFEYEDDLIRDLDSEQRVRDSIEIRKSAVEYIIDHFPTKETTDNENKRESQIADLKAEHDDLKEQLAKQQERNKIFEEQTKTIQEQKEEIARLKEELNATQLDEQNKIELNRLLAENEELALAVQSYKDQGKGLTAPEAAILITAICLEMNQIPANGREGLAPIIEFCWGKSSSTSSEALRRKVTNDSVEKLARKFDSLTPKLARIIRELPQKLEERNNERLMHINPKVNK